MNDLDMNNGLGSCSPSDCASCGGGCGGSGVSMGPNGELPSHITLTMEDDTEVTCQILTHFPVDGKEYIALLPIDTEGNTNGEVYLYTFSVTETGDPMLANIEDDDEYNKACIAFDTILQNAQSKAADFVDDAK